MKLSPQARTVLAHMRDESHITSWQAEGVYRIRRLASRIDEIVAAGFEVVKERSSDATGQSYTRYSLSTSQRHSPSPIRAPRKKATRVSLDAIRAEMLAMDFDPLDIDELINNLQESA